MSNKHHTSEKMTKEEYESKIEEEKLKREIMRKEREHSERTHHKGHPAKHIVHEKAKQDIQKKNITIEEKESEKKLLYESIFKKEEKTESNKYVETYKIEVDGASVDVNITKDKEGMHYVLIRPEIEVATSALLTELRNELVSMTTINMNELIDPTAFNAIKDRFFRDASTLLKSKLPTIDKDTEKFLTGKLIQDMLGLGDIEFLINDPSLEEIVIPSAKEHIRVYSKKYGWINTNLKIEREDEIINYSNIIARRVGRQITILSPLLDAHLVSGDRINAVLYPINTKGNTITIRKFARDPYTIVDLINNKTCDMEIAALIWLGTEFEMNVLISGGTASGKTSFLNACMPFVPPNQRIISIEDTRELMLPEFLYWAPLVTRTPNPEGKGEVSMLDLLVNSLRMRPDRIILGEMRKKEEATVLFEAMHTGHSVFATVHADSAAETISRLMNPPLDIPANLLKAVNLNVVMFRDRRRGMRRVIQVAEFETAGNTARSNILYRWSPDQDKMIKHSESSRFFEDISRNTGLSNKEIENYLEEKKKILSWLIKHSVRKLDDLGKVFNLYYTNKEFLINALERDDMNSVLLKK